MQLKLQQANGRDEKFLFQVYASTCPEVADWGWDQAQQNAFLRMQFNAQLETYNAAYGQAEHSIIFCDDRPVGRIIVLREERCIRLVDIAVLSGDRNRGIGTRLVS